MGSYNSKQVGIVVVPEVTNGTRVEPQASDSDTIIWGEGFPTINSGNEPIGMLADGTMNEGPVKSGQHMITLPDFSMFLQHSDDLTGATEPFNWKFAKACGADVITDVTKGLLWDGTPNCTTLSADVKNLACDGKTALYKGRGMKGNMIIGWDGANAPITMQVTGMQGALDGRDELAGQVPYVVTGNDTTNRETAATYTTTILGAVFQVAVMSFDPAIEVSMEPANNEQGIATAKATGMQKRVKMTVIQLTDGDPVFASAFDLSQTPSIITIAGGVGAGFDMTFEGAEQLEPTIADVDGSTGWELDFKVDSGEFLQKDLS